MAGAVPVNHHADHPGFVGVTGLLAGLTMSASVGETVLVSGKGFGASEIVVLGPSRTSRCATNTQSS